jgi:isoleucyl-tRNA synthetase
MTDRPLFDKVPTALDFPGEEREVLALWRDRRVFERSLEASAGRPEFVFYEGPPTANGLPHNGHVLTRVDQGSLPALQDDAGYHVRAQGGLGHPRPARRGRGREGAAHPRQGRHRGLRRRALRPKCIESVFRYTDEWEQLTERIGFWVDLEDAYVTYHKSYVESVWWALSELFKKGLLYQGHKVVWWWAQGGTALSSGEVGSGLQDRRRPSVFVASPRVDEPDLGGAARLDDHPWTLPSNMYAAVRSTTYRVRRPSKRRAAAKDPRRQGGSSWPRSSRPPSRRSSAAELRVSSARRRARARGRALRAAVRPPTRAARRGPQGGTAVVRVIAADFVTLDAAPASCTSRRPSARTTSARSRASRGGEGLPLFCAVRPDGTFSPSCPLRGALGEGRDKDIQQELKERGLLVHAESYRHEYPFCWRATATRSSSSRGPPGTSAPPPDRPRPSQQPAVAGCPSTSKRGASATSCANNVDWALSRERYWGTPLNIWVCKD